MLLEKALFLGLEIQRGAVDAIAQPVLARTVREDVAKVAFFRPSPVRVLEPAMGKLLVAAPQFPESGYVAVGRSAKAEIVVLGTSLWWDWITPNKSDGADNARLLGNLLKRPKKVE